MQVLETVEAVRRWRAGAAGVALVPTMGYLHAGHLALVEAAKATGYPVLVTIFVNPTQFAANEDFTRYPRDLERDLRLLRAAGVAAAFTPDATIMYPRGFQTQVSVGAVAEGKEGAARPGHFVGVATVVCKLFNITQATVAFFGQKDAQQVAVIRRMVADLNLPVEVRVQPTVREADGLAMSSRNVYLTPEQRTAATVLYRSLQAASHAYDAGERDPQRLIAVARGVLAEEALAEVDYVDVSLAATLEVVTAPTDAPLLLSLAVKIGQPRLLDNCLLPAALNTAEGATSTLGAVSLEP
jgi:pantoate--beta-alanine ligase